MKLEVHSARLQKISTDLLVIILDKELKLSAIEDPELAGLLKNLGKDFEEKTVKKEYFSRWTGGIKHILVFHTALNASYNVWERIKIYASRAVSWGSDLNLKQVTFLLNGTDAPAYFGKIVEGVIVGGYAFERYKVEKNTYLGEAVVSLLTGQWPMLLIIGIIPLSEMLSVVIQIGYFKWTKGKRFFKMAPIHLHFELLGWSETQVVQRFWLIGLMAALIGIGLSQV